MPNPSLYPSIINIPTSQHHKTQRQRRYLVYFITGNPGLIAYYHSYLHALHSSLHSTTTCTEDDPTYRVYGRSLAGFELNNVVDTVGRSGERKRRVYSLQEQIEYVECGMLDVATSMRREEEIVSNPDLVEESSSVVKCNNVHEARNGGHYNTSKESRQEQPVQVILVGHSVGAYIAMEILQRHKHRLRKHDTASKGITKSNGEDKNKAMKNVRDAIDVAGVICLFPTVTHIGKSRNGRMFTVSFMICLLFACDQSGIGPRFW